MHQFQQSEFFKDGKCWETIITYNDGVRTETALEGCVLTRTRHEYDTRYSIPIQYTLYDIPFKMYEGEFGYWYEEVENKSDWLFRNQKEGLS